MTKPDPRPETLPCFTCGCRTDAKPLAWAAAIKTATTLQGVLPPEVTRRNNCPECAAIIASTTDNGRRRGLLLLDLLGTTFGDGLDPEDPDTMVALAKVACSDTGLPIAGYRDEFSAAAPDLAHAGGPGTVPRPGSGTKRRWEHVAKEHREALGLRVHAVRRRLHTPVRHRLGSCGLCGRRKSLRWGKSAVLGGGLGRPAPSKWPLCWECSEVWRHSDHQVTPESGFPSRFAARLVPGIRSGMAVPLVMPFYAAVEPGTRPEDAGGCAEPGGYLGADLDRLRMWSARRWPESADAGTRARLDRSERVAALADQVRPRPEETRPRLVRLPDDGDDL